jgi:hypothetical protein
MTKRDPKGIRRGCQMVLKRQVTQPRAIRMRIARSSRDGTSIVSSVKHAPPKGRGTPQTG